MSTSASEATITASAEVRNLYIELLKKTLTMTLWDAGDGSQEQILRKRQNRSTILTKSA